MPVSPRTFNQVGLLVENIGRASEQLERAVGLRFEAPVQRRIGEWTVLVAYSLHGPPYIELIEAPPGTPWSTDGSARLDHIGFWSEDLDADGRRLADAGLPLAVDGTSLGGRWFYHLAADAGIRIEHIEESARKAFGERRGGPGRRSTQATVDAYFDGINEERYADVADLFTPAGVLMAPGTRPRQGAEEIASYFAAALAPYPEHLDTPTRVVLSGSTAVAEIHFAGRHAKGGTMEFEAVDVFDFDMDGSIVSMTSWYDSHRVRQQLAALSPGG
jgi:ketosteroid isomerase-like protein